MKSLLIISIFLVHTLFANYNYSNQGSGKIDMHGGKSDSLVNNKSLLSNMNSNMLSDKTKEKKESKREVLEEKKLQELKDLGL